MRKIRNKGFYQLFILMILVSLLLTISSIVIIYKIIYQDKKAFLQELCENQKTIIQSIYHGQNDVDAVLNALYKQKAITKGLGTTGEFIVGYKKNDSIFFLLKSRSTIDVDYTPIALKSKKALPLQYALSQKTGFVQGLDYKGDLVLAYCTFIPELKWGLVTKMNVSEVRMPFYRAGIYALMVSLILVLIFIFFFRKVSGPLVKKIEESEKNYHKLFEYSAIPIWRQDYTELKKYFDQLKNSGISDFRIYFETHKEEISHLASLVKIVEINQTSLALFEAGSKENVIKNMLNYFNEESLEIFREEITLLAEGVTQIVSEIPIITLSGNIKKCSLHLAVVKGFEDTLSNVLVSFIDITERKLAEKTLKENEEKYLTTLSSIGDAVIATDADGKITFLNPVAELLTGWTMEEAKQHLVHEVFSILNEFTNEVAESPIDKVIQQGKIVALADHTILLKKDGSKVPIDDSCAPIRDNEGNIIGVVLVFRDISDRKITEENRARLASIIETSDDAIISKNLNDIITTWNHGAEIIFGYTSNEILGKSISAIIPPGYENEEISITNKIIKGLDVKHYETKRICKDGTIIDISVSVSPQHDFYGRLIGVSKIIRNITESKKDRYELIRLNRTLQALGESSQAMMYSTDETNYLRNVCRIVVDDCGHLMAWIGFAMDDPGKTVKPVTSYGIDKGYTEKLNISWADTPNGCGPTGQAIRSAKPVVCHHINTDSNFEPWCKDAIDRGFASAVVIPLIDQIKVIGVLNIYSKEPDPFTVAEIELLSDIAADLVHGINTLRLRNSEKVAMDMLTASEKKLWSVLHATQESIYMFDRRGKFLLSNAIGLKRLNNISPHKLIGHHFSEFMTDELAKQKQVMFDKVFQSGKPVEFIDERKGIKFHHNFFPVFDQGEVSYIVVYSVDITQRVEYENALEEKNLELQKINATKDKFFSIIAHDLKNPFISLLGASEMLYQNVERFDKKRIKELSKILNDSAKSGYNMLLNLLEWARSQAGSMIFTPEPINLKELIDKNLFNLNDIASAKEITLNFTVDGNIELYADRNMLNSILRNLVNNALKFTPRGGEVTVGSTTKNNSLVIFVKDTGVGIANSDYDKLFRKDIKYSHPGTDYEIGTGLGLLLCQEFVEKHGGRIWFESTVGKGSNFYFSILNQNKD